MKRVIAILSIIVAGVSAFAVVNQSGYVKTRGRLGSNGQVVPGKRLSNATVILQNNSSVVSNKSGNFSLVLPANNYILKNVKKTGYVLADPEILRKQYAYSPNPLVLVLDEPTALQDDRLASERKLRRNLQRQLQSKEDELEALREENKITQEQYREAMQKLYSDQESNEKFIAEMAERYSQIDFDQLDDFQKQMAAFIQNGELVRADSLLRTKGSMDQREEELKKIRDANIKEREELSMREENLSKSIRNEAILLADFGADCYNHFELCKLRFDNDSAAYWLERRVLADTTNSTWHRDLAHHLYTYMGEIDRSRSHYQKALSLAKERYGENSDQVAICLTNIGNLETIEGNFNEALRLYDKAIEIYSGIYGNESSIVFENYANKAHIYGERGENDKAIALYEDIIDKLEKGEDANLLASNYNGLGCMYSNINQYPKAIEYLEKALEINTSISDPYSSPDVATNYLNLGTIFSEMENTEIGLEYLLKAKDIFCKIYNKNHNSVANVYNALSTALIGTDNQKALEYSQKSLEIKENIFGKKSPRCASALNTIGSICFHTGDYESALVWFKEGAERYMAIHGEMNPKLGVFFNNIAQTYDQLNLLEEAKDNYLRTANLYSHNFGEMHPDVALCYKSIGSIFLDQEDYQNALSYLKRASEINLKVYGKNHRETMRCFQQVGITNNHMGNYKDAYDFLSEAYNFFISEEGWDKGRASLNKNYIYITLTKGTKEGAFDNDKLKEFLQNNIMTVSIAPGDNPARSQGLDGEYYLLQYNTWDLESSENLYDLTASLQGKPKTVVLMKDGNISKHDFEDKIGCGFGIETISPTDKADIISALRQWNSK